MKPLDIVIRQSQPGDYDGLAELSYAHMTPEQLRTYHRINPKAVARFNDQISGNQGVCLLAQLDNEYVGYLAGDIKSTPLTTIKFAELETITVKPEYRNRGIGTLLAERFLLWSKAVGADRASVVASPTNAEAIKFYERLGFTPSSLELEITL